MSGPHNDSATCSRGTFIVQVVQVNSVANEITLGEKERLIEQTCELVLGP